MRVDNLLLLGIRHHGPGSAASVVRALKEFQPDAILLEGAPEAAELIPLVGDKDLKPPVAQLIYCPDNHQDSTFYPFAEFSPEWQTLLYANREGVAVEFFDLPQAHSIGLRQQRRDAEPVEVEVDEQEDESVDSLEFDSDPLDLLAKTAGYGDGESWWEAMVEQHQHSSEVFTLIAEAMTSAREQIEQHHPISEREQRREAWMRQRLRAAQKSGAEKIAVVCGAWHVPALLKKVAVKDDRALLKGLPKAKVSATWIPWTYGRISYRSGYGAGIEAPGWYDYLWQHWQAKNNHRVASGWLTKVARVLRAEGLDVPSASVIEAVRLAESLALLRERESPSFNDMNEAIQTLFGYGDAASFTLLKEKLWLSERLGQVPDSSEQTPLQQSFHHQVKTLRLKIGAVEKEMILDLRKELDRNRSQFFHQLGILGLEWAKPISTRSKGTFKEGWLLQWYPECDLQLIEKSIWGNSIEAAATATAIDAAGKEEDLSALVAWLEKCLPANLEPAIVATIAALSQRSTISSGVDELMAALPGLVNIIRYGDVRGTDTNTLQDLVNDLCIRINIGLPNQCKQLDEESAQAMAVNIAKVNSALALLDQDSLLEEWRKVLLRLANNDGLQGFIVGRCFRLLEDSGVIDQAAVAEALSLALSRAEDPLQAAAWLEGLLADSGLTLLHDDTLFAVLDNYLCGLAGERFEAITPLLRRTFATFAFGERRNLLDKVRQGVTALVEIGDEHFDHEKGAKILPLLTILLQPQT